MAFIRVSLNRKKHTQTQIIKAMGLFNGNTKQMIALQAEVASLQRQNYITATTNFVQSSIALYPDVTKFENPAKYSSLDDLYSIIRLLATTAALIPFYTYEIKDDNAVKKIRQLQVKSDLRIRKNYETKGLEDLPDSDPLNLLLDNPNTYQSKFEFFEALYTFLFVQGECFVYKPKIEFGVNAGKISDLHLMFPQHVILRISSAYPHEIIGYDYIVDGVKIMESIPVEDVIHMKYFNPNFTISGSELRGLSPLVVLRKRLTRMESNLDNSVSQMQNGGVPGIVYEKGEPAPETAGARKDNFYRYLQNKSNKGAPFFATGELDYISLGLSLADLDAAKLEEIDFKKLCNAFGVSDILFNNDKAATESNVNLKQKTLYTNTILPNVYRVRDAFNMQIVPLYKDKKRFINCDISEIPELQENYKDLVGWLAAAWWLTPNEKREALKFERIQDASFDVPLIPSGIKLLSDLTAIDPLPIPNASGL